MLCPMKFSFISSDMAEKALIHGIKHREDNFEINERLNRILECEKEKCAWWDDDEECCVILAIKSRIYHISKTLWDLR